ncbi:hypothetical protein SG0102_26940 [Intestinibaculum porci]|uniref:Uncharacterized protein n=1 Tax=Intestinibaculum porci TaxID=2487118 RepID=A0A3G9J9N6_9FIRM|nr:hypothetical protein [Intestinibaculum porci]BBH27760.1 hypothetical protein SG0102_26940 [Intestinibaculum porci]
MDDIFLEFIDGIIERNDTHLFEKIEQMIRNSSLDQDDQDLYNKEDDR